MRVLSIPLSLGLVLASVAPSAAELRFDADRVPVGAVYQYEKSNIDGSHAGRIAVYVADTDRLESYKWTAGYDRATLVQATMDWKRFSIARFETAHVFADGRVEPQAILATEGDSLVARVGEMEMSVTVERWPWHSYDFDFTSLGFVWRHRTDPEAPFRFGITDFVRTDDGGALKDKGWVDVAFTDNVERNGHACREYTIDGDGLERRGGKIWFRESDSVLVDYEIDLPDEPGLESGKLRLVSEERMTPDEWQQFKLSRFD